MAALCGLCDKYKTEQDKPSAFYFTKSTNLLNMFILATLIKKSTNNPSWKSAAIESSVSSWLTEDSRTADSWDKVVWSAGVKPS